MKIFGKQSLVETRAAAFAVREQASRCFGPSAGKYWVTTGSKPANVANLPVRTASESADSAA
jgi:hypothetical protein